jgi:hypothetical protein
MPRDANGNYTLPPGNPVVSGTPISSVTHNSTNNDIAANLTDSLSRSGLGGMLAPLQFDDGSAPNPSITFSNEQSTGIYRSGSGEWAVSVLGIKQFTVADDGVYSENPFYEWNVGLASYVPLLNAADDYTIEGAWDFTQTLTVNGIVYQSLGAYVYHNDPTLSSGKIFVDVVAPGPGDGSEGDLWLEIE